ncbi:AfsR/SARP family transcriptional regulator [Actinoallomurus rhizosphaericola]|uniref:AfsR/SARP family transcriptional regulator n=1 Tax=Actinoallomurus rhizosphaericola TaxID=2952536 RepID=UPI0020934AFC|nr:BTAD domain-containing putative transcriptional regulator [Actinoallomurus rhizosphaericola]MCO5999771.1 NB-ARC domain-containing protein [Actinoallomurus rhizosphaericola]
MKFRILGSFEVVSEGGTRVVTRPLARGVLFVLVLYRNQALPPDRLVDLLWGPAGDDDRLHSLRTRMWDLRQILTAERLVTDDVGYRLRIDPNCDEVDVDRFRNRHHQGRAALAADDPVTAARLLDEAMAQWTTDQLADLLPDTPAMAALVTGLIEERRDARNALVSARLALGQHRELLPELRTLVAVEPGNEQAWADLMLTLYRCGLQADALQAFTDAEAALAAHIGVEPGPALRSLRRRIQGNDPQLRPPAATGARGGHQLGRGVPRQLPADLGDFTGREEEAAEMIALLSPASSTTAPRVVEVSGPPGIGKTALALRVAHAVVHDYPDGQLYLRLAGASPASRKAPELLGEVLHALRVPTSDIPPTLAQRAALVRTMLADQRMLIVLDDATCLEQVQPLLPGAAGCAVIITSRTRLAGIATGRSIALGPLDHRDALQLLSRLAGLERVNADPAAAGAVVEACGRFPLAVRIAAERLVRRPSWPIAYLAHRLADEKTRLDELVVGNLAVRASIALSYQALKPAAQRAFRLLALAGTGEFSAWAGDVILGEPSGVLIDVLVDHSLLAAIGIDPLGQPRYRFHDLVREYAVELLASAPDTDVARERVMKAWLELADVADALIPRGLHAPPRTRPPLAARVVQPSLAQRVADVAEGWFAAERQNLLATVETACGLPGGYRLARELALRLAAYLRLYGCHDDAEHMWTTIAQSAEAVGETAFAARAWLRAAIVLAGDRTDPIPALPLVARCITTFERAKDHQRLARAYGLRAYCTIATGDLHASRADAERGLALARKNGDPHAEFLCLRVLGGTLVRLGRHAEGITRCEEALELAHHQGNTRYVCVALHSLAKARLHAGRPDAVLDLCRQGLSLSIDGREPLRAYFHRQAGLAYQHLHLHDAAIDALTIAADLFGARHADYEYACCLHARAKSHQATGNYNQGASDLEKAIILFNTLGRRDLEKQAREDLANYQPME